MVVGSEARLSRIPDVRVRMDGVILEDTVQKKETLLGVVIQNNLKWSAQVETLTTKLKKW